MHSSNLTSVSQSSTGVKFDEDKSRWDLVPWDAMEEIVKVLNYGANKYTIKYNTEWDRLLDAQDVVEIKISIAKKYVVVVTKNNLGKIILNSEKNKGRIVEIGKNVIPTKLGIMPSAGNLIQSLVQEIDEQNRSHILRNIILPKNNRNSIATKVVKFVEQQNTYILTIVTKQGNLEVFFVLSAITDSVFWEILWKDLCEQLNIWRPQERTGERNWEKGMEYGRLIRATISHLTQWAMRKSIDEESGLSHLAHAGCNILFLLSYSLRGVGTDNRPEIRDEKLEAAKTQMEYIMRKQLHPNFFDSRKYDESYPLGHPLHTYYK